MNKQEFWYNQDARKVGTIPTGCIADQFIFLSAQTPIDLETVALVKYPWDLPPDGRKCIMTGWEVFDAQHGPIRAQTWMIYHNLSKILAQHGSSLDNVIRQRIYLRDTNETGAMEEIQLSFFPQAKPATTILGIAEHGQYSDIHIQVEMIAFIPREGGLHKENIYIPELSSVTAPYPQAVRVGQFLFSSGLLGIDPTTGKVVTKLEELGADKDKLRSGNRQTDSTAEAMKAQYWLTNKLLDKIIKSQGGAGLNCILRKNQFYGGGFKEQINRYPIRLKLYKTREESPPVTSFGLYNMSVVKEATVITDAVALLPGEYRKEVNVVDETPGFFPMWSKAGPFWFFSGELGLNRANHYPIQFFSDISDAGRYLAHSRFQEVQTDVMAQTWWIYQSIHKQMLRAGSGLSNVVQQNIYVRNISDYLAVERIAGIVYGDHIPSTTLIPVDELGPYKELKVEIEVISLT